MSFLSILKNLQDSTEAGITFLVNERASHLSYSELLKLTPIIAGKLKYAGVKSNQYVIFQITDNQPLIEMFWGSVWLGAIPVIAPPALTENDENRISKIFKMLPEALVLADEKTKRHLSSSRSLLLSDLYSIDANPVEGESPSTEDTIRLVQMSSGSTGSPKGIVVSEQTLMSAMEATIPQHPQRFQNSMLTWLPLTHNLSLLGFHIYAMFRGFPQVLMPTSDFIMNPLSWFSAITKYQPTVTVCPNFGFIHVLRYLQTRGVPKGVSYDFSNIQKVISASEPIDAQIAKSFSNKLSKYGLQENAIVAAYGMSEACLQITTTGIYEPLRTISLDRSQIKIGVRYQDIVQAKGAEFVSVGKSVPGMEVSIRDEHGIVPADSIGEIYIRGTSMTHASISIEGIIEHDLTEDGFFATGDIGIIHDENLYVVARKKDIIFVNGKNYYSPDLEALILAELGTDSVVLGRTSPFTGEEEVFVFVAEEDRASKDNEITSVLTSKAGVPVSQVIRIPIIPRAANGKKMRRELEALL